MKKLIILLILTTVLKQFSYGYCIKNDSICFTVKQAALIYSDLQTCKDSLSYYTTIDNTLNYAYVKQQNITCKDSLIYLQNSIIKQNNLNTVNKRNIIILCFIAGVEFFIIAFR
jgi:hypothetical protein